MRRCIDSCVWQIAGPDLTRPDVLKVVDTLGKVFKLLERLSERERELQLWEREGGHQACTVVAGVLFHALDIVHASVLVTPQTQRVRLADGISRQLTRIEHGLGGVLSGMPEDELSMLTKVLLEIEHFELVRALVTLYRRWCAGVEAVRACCARGRLICVRAFAGGRGDCNGAGLDISACGCAGQILGSLPL